jgi:hypothetical protein
MPIFLPGLFECLCSTLCPFMNNLCANLNRNSSIVFFSTDLELVREKIKSAGGKIVKDIFEFPGGQRFHFTDSSGNELAVWSDK